MPGLAADRVKVQRLSEDRKSLFVLLQPPTPSADGAALAEGGGGSVSGPVVPLVSEVLLIFQQQIHDPSSPLRRGEFGAYAAYCAVGEKSAMRAGVDSVRLAQMQVSFVVCPSLLRGGLRPLCVF